MSMSMSDILDEQNTRDLHTKSVPAIRVNHLGQVPQTVGDVFGAVGSLTRPAYRGAHVGSWTEIWNGRVGLVDYNRYLCRDFKLAELLLHSHTFTETADLSVGDKIYLPRGVVRDGSYERLALFVKRGETYVPVPADKSVCCAFSAVERRGRMVPLLVERTGELETVHSYATIASMLTDERLLLSEVLLGLVEYSRTDASVMTVSTIFGSSVDRQGERGPAPVAAGDGFVIGDTRYESADALVAAGVEALEYGRLDNFALVEEPQPEGRYLPLLSAPALLALVAFWDSRGAISGRSAIHAQWGAISMTGYPPLSLGYLGQRAHRKSLRLIGDGLRRMPVFDFNMRFVLLPAPLLSLVPPAENSRDVELVEELLTRVRRDTPLPGADPNLAQDAVSRVVREWLEAYSGELSEYYLRRFGVARSVVNGTRQIPVDGSPAPLGSLSDLTMQQASMILGGLMTQAKDVVANGV